MGGETANPEAGLYKSRRGRSSRKHKPNEIPHIRNAFHKDESVRHTTPYMRMVSLFFRYYKGFISMDARERRFRLTADKVHAGRVKREREAHKKERQVDISFRQAMPAHPFSHYQLQPQQIL